MDFGGRFFPPHSHDFPPSSHVFPPYPLSGFFINCLCFHFFQPTLKKPIESCLELYFSKKSLALFDSFHHLGLEVTVWQHSQPQVIGTPLELLVCVSWLNTSHNWKDQHLPSGQSHPCPEPIESKVFSHQPPRVKLTEQSPT